MRTLFKTFLIAAVASPLAAQTPQQASAPAAPPIPSAGEAAPDFTLPWTNGKGMKEDFTLSKHRGEVVVLAFYPADFSRGCTIQMSKYRDDYKSIFGDNGVTLVPISRDSIPMHTRWADTMAFPFRLASDTAGSAASLYKSMGRGNYFARNVFVIGKDGKIAYSHSFNPNAQGAYDDLAAAIAEAKKK